LRHIYHVLSALPPTLTLGGKTVQDTASQGAVTSEPKVKNTKLEKKNKKK
jgi:hypothetical protein